MSGGDYAPSLITESTTPWWRRMAYRLRDVLKTLRH